jgi:hypothetical protein
MRKTLAGLLTICLGLPTITFAQLSAATDASTHPVLASRDVMAFTWSQAPTSDTAAGSQDAATIRDVVKKLGVGKKIRLRTVTDEEVRGRITTIGDDTFTMDAGQRRVFSYADVSALKRQGMNGWLKGGIVAGAVFGGLMLMTGICYWSGSCVS